MTESMIHQTIERVNDIYRAVMVPITIVLGVFGNIIIIIVLSRQFVGRFEIYCLTLAVVQILALIFNSLLDDFLGRGMEFITNGKASIKIDQLSDLFCKFMEFTPRVMYFTSAYVMVVMAVDRYLVISKGSQFPAPTRHVFRAKAFCLAIFSFGVILCSPCLYYYTINRKSFENRHFTNISCKLSTPGFSELFFYFQSVLFYVFPIVVVVICNFLIVQRIMSRRQLRKRLSSASSIKKDANSGSMKLIGYLAISSGFLLVSLPLAIIIIIRSVISGPVSKNKNKVDLNLSEASKLTSSIKDVYYAINFYLNFLFLSRFRKSVLTLFQPSRRLDEDDFSTKRNLTKTDT